MKVLISALQGSVLFLVLLVTQVVIVSSLTLTAIWLYFKRLRQEALVDEGGAGHPEFSAGFAQVKSGEMIEHGTSSQPLEKPSSELAEALEVERNKFLELQRENLQSIEKIKGLEGRLLEFEVLKEEIGHLSQLKVENQNLKEEISRLNKPASQTDNVNSSSESSEKTQTDLKTLPEEKEETPTLSVMSVEQEPPAKQKVNEAPQAVEAPVASPPTSETLVVAVNQINPAVDPSADPGLEGLLNEIEALTSSDNKELLRKRA